ncbi:hypothetical protein LTR10_014506 [Elasticomyces elasticus]|uniref:F-box domain-containing protein n=1 Tax=Exophiala sideris TaxID=1016849 RepID=A0ABR0JS93_9EURO|nr:hypothetical protein LTR10_014506 [Elasticomyces elasticus]KAK5040485.1 hypothetical protein LTS07_000983 [Exophiala sideris]KAK5043089.1 hypothetical protein LTR13_000860 [Exophiala sideris]KAK5068863.1 hypothetical protein LTR69_000984 [Exophiala sideris]KAK5186459.1 hypothetical protein LTR44_001515 [Eurotiomycetes sp. CCFEE 6388]
MSLSMPTSTALAPPLPKSPRSFLDLPQEVRIMIYHHLFDDSHLRLVLPPKRDTFDPYWYSVPRDYTNRPDDDGKWRRRWGSNILFASKTCLAEGIAIFLQAAKFTFPAGQDPWREHGTLQGITRRELPMISSLELSVNRIEREPWHLPNTDCWGGLTELVIDYQNLKTDIDFKLWLVDLPLPLHMRHRWVKLGHRSFFEVMKKAAARNAKATFEIKFSLLCTDMWVKIGAELLTQTIWATNTLGTETIIKKRHEPRLLRNLLEEWSAAEEAAVREAERAAKLAAERLAAEIAVMDAEIAAMEAEHDDRADEENADDDTEENEDETDDEVEEETEDDESMDDESDDDIIQVTTYFYF